MHSQNVRVIARRLNVTLDDKYIEVVTKKAFSKDPSYSESRTGAMILVVSNYFFNKGVKGSDAYKLGHIAGSAFYSLNHGNIKNVVIAVEMHGTELDSDLKEEIAELLTLHITERTKEHTAPSFGNVMAMKIKNQHKYL